MKENLDGQNEVGRYLLGVLDDPPKMRQIEADLMVDDNFEEEVSRAEDGLIEQYLDDELSEAEKKQFESFFLSNPERARKFRFSQNLRKYAAAAMPVAAPAREEGGYFSWRQYFSLPALRFAALLLIVTGLGYGVWRIGIYQSDVDKGLAQLKLAYKNDRPFKARIVGFDYDSPPPDHRGGPDDRKDPDPPERQKQEQAASTLDIALKNSRNAKTLYASGKAFLAKKDFEKAIGLFEEAAGLDPENAGLQSDLGTAYLEMSAATVKKDGARESAQLEEARKHLEKAIGLDSGLLEPRFNLAIALDALADTGQAKKAWNEYIALDPASPWTAEARSRLKTLEEKP